MRRATHSCRAESPRAPPAEETPTRRFFRCTTLIMLALLLPATIQALLNIIPNLLQPHETAIVMAFALSATIVATTLLIAALVRGRTGGTSDRV